MEIAEEPRMISVIDVDIKQNNIYYFLTRQDFFLVCRINYRLLVSVIAEEIFLQRDDRMLVQWPTENICHEGEMACEVFEQDARPHVGSFGVFSADCWSRSRVLCCKVRETRG